MYNCDMCDYTTSIKRGGITHKGHKYKEEVRKEKKNNSLKLLVVDVGREEENISIPLSNSSLEDNPVPLTMQDNGFSKLEMCTLDDTPQSKIWNMNNTKS